MAEGVSMSSLYKGLSVVSTVCEAFFLLISSLSEMAADSCRDFAEFCDEKANNVNR
jgi:hypothetical protein